MKNCPYCDEKITNETKQCPYCQECIGSENRANDKITYGDMMARYSDSYYDKQHPFWSWQTFLLPKGRMAHREFMLAMITIVVPLAIIMYPLGIMIIYPVFVLIFKRWKDTGIHWGYLISTLMCGCLLFSITGLMLGDIFGYNSPLGYIITRLIYFGFSLILLFAILIFLSKKLKSQPTTNQYGPVPNTKFSNF